MSEDSISIKILFYKWKAVGKHDVCIILFQNKYGTQHSDLGREVTPLIGKKSRKRIFFQTNTGEVL
jgi:hypothetical protein